MKGSVSTRSSVTMASWCICCPVVVRLWPWTPLKRFSDRFLAGNIFSCNWSVANCFDASAGTQATNSHAEWPRAGSAVTVDSFLMLHQRAANTRFWKCGVNPTATRPTHPRSGTVRWGGDGLLAVAGANRLSVPPKGGRRSFPSIRFPIGRSPSRSGHLSKVRYPNITLCSGCC